MTSDNNIYNTGTNTRSNNNRKKSYSNQQEVSEKLDDEESNSNTRLQQQQIIVKSVLRKRRNASVSTIKSDHSPRRRYNVLLFGDSLTAGWMKNSEGYASYYPYGLRLQKRFEEEGLDVEVTVSGVPGECVVSMEERLKNELEQPGKWYDWVVILGGTNDVINGYSAWEIFDGLREGGKILLHNNNKTMM
ncbi:9931_t:CDS:2 [Entrophospora sp. SA101]|nr:9931_t:CDS:2 [Entrophospora sp. SA101]